MSLINRFSVAAISVAMFTMTIQSHSAVSAKMPPNAALDKALAAVVNNPAKPLASLSVLAVRNGKISYHQQFGARWIDNENPANNKPANAQTLYRIASISKTVTAIGVMKLVETGKINLDRDISDYLGYKLRNPHFADDAITMRMLLSHTSTILDNAGYYWDEKTITDLKDVLLPDAKRYGAGAVWSKAGKPGAYFQYANLPWGVIGTVMERVTNERFDHLMQRLVLTPLNLKGGFHPADMPQADLLNVATLYRKRSVIDNKEVWNTDGPWVAQVDDYTKIAPLPRATAEYIVGTNGTLFGPQGNCRLSAEGLSTIMFMLMNRGQHNGRAYLQKKTVDEMLKTQWRTKSDGKNGESTYSGGKALFNAWGLGVQQFTDVSYPDTGIVGKSGGGGDRLAEAGGYTAIGHLGDAWGLTSAMVFNAKEKSGMIFMHGGPGFNPETNLGKYSAMYRHEEEILNALYVNAVQAVKKTKAVRQ
jgi:CubicO group peptidase (beta-lactamase class C family)